MKDAIDLFNSDLADLPRRATDDYRKAFRDAVRDYSTAVSQTTATDYVSNTIRANRRTIEDCGAAIVSALDEALRGQPDRSSAAMANAIAQCDPWILRLFSRPVGPEQLNPLYRVRTASLFESLDRGDLFHIPFDRRHLAAPRRYSLLGVPCLYLGGSLYVCWEEMGRPDLKDLWMSTFVLRPNEKLTVLDFGYRPALVAAMLNHHGLQTGPTSEGELAVAHGICWPLIAACSFSARHRSAPFVIEYLVPQLLLRWIAETDELLGVRYFSTHVTAYGGEMVSMNYVFPAIGDAPEHWARALTKRFEVSAPINWQLADQMGMLAPVRTGSQVQIEVADGAKVLYEDTQFAAMEKRLSSLPRTSIQ